MMFVCLMYVGIAVDYIQLHEFHVLPVCLFLQLYEPPAPDQEEDARKGAKKHRLADPELVLKAVAAEEEFARKRWTYL